MQRQRVWAKVISIRDTTALGVTADGKYVLIPARHQTMDSLLIGDFVSFSPDQPSGQPIFDTKYKVEFFARDPFIEARSMRAWKELLLLIRPRLRGPKPQEHQHESSITLNG